MFPATILNSGSHVEDPPPRLGNKKLTTSSRLAGLHLVTPMGLTCLGFHSVVPGGFLNAFNLGYARCVLHVHIIDCKNCGFLVNSANVVGLTHQVRNIFSLMSLSSAVVCPLSAVAMVSFHLLQLQNKGDFHPTTCRVAVWHTCRT